MSGQRWCHRLRATALTGLAIVFAPGSASSGQLLDRGLPSAHLQVSLISEAAAIVPGRQFWIGLNFALDPGWHVYWINAGDSGQPPRVTWTIPAGYTVGPLEWPQPTRITDSTTIVDYGYERHVLLMAPVNVPWSARLGRSVDIAGDVDWLVCREVCVPGKTRLSLKVQVVAKRKIDAAKRPIFEAARRKVPKAMPAAWKARAESVGDRVNITIDTGHPEHGATFFPLEDLQVDNAAPQRAEPFARGLRLSVKKAEPIGPLPKTLKGVVAFGRNSAYVVNIPLEGGK
jgi:thiol:disulfide interchange protein DsbD